jgi:hypothetical protein
VAAGGACPRLGPQAAQLSGTAINDGAAISPNVATAFAY